MYQMNTYHDPEECRQVWEQLWPSDCVFDLWPVRLCFLKSYKRPLHFIVCEKDHVPLGMMALCWIEEEQMYGHFPGETWKSRTWLEQNRLVSSHPDMAADIIGAVPGPAQIRYLTRDAYFQTRGCVDPDETGYLFIPAKYGYLFERYMAQFSGKTRKKIRGELAGFEKQGVTIEYNRLLDVDRLLKMNMESFGQDSYFSDPRFLAGFEHLVSFLVDHKMIRITTVRIAGQVAAVDIGALYKKTYTLLAGGTHPEFKGVAKLINLHHMRRACTEKWEYVDFLCGDFNWKERFHLSVRSLYGLNLRHAPAVSHVPSFFDTDRSKEDLICA